MHKLLNRQLKRFFSSTKAPNPPEAFIEAIDQAYKQTDQDRELLERSLDLTSKELSTRNQILRSQLKELKATHGQLQHSIATLNATFNSTGEAIFVVDGDSKTVQMNQMALSMLKIPNDKLTHSLPYCLKCLLPLVEKTLDLKQHLRMANEDSLKDLFGFSNFKDGQLYEFHSSAQTNQNKVIGRVWCVRNVTETKKKRSNNSPSSFPRFINTTP